MNIPVGKTFFEMSLVNATVLVNNSSTERKLMRSSGSLYPLSTKSELSFRLSFLKLLQIPIKNVS